MGADPYLCVADPTGRLPPLWDGPLRPGRDSDHMNTVGEPYSGKPNVRFDEGRPGRRQPNRPPTLPGIARIAGSSGRAKSCRPRIVVPARGFEPRTLGLKGRCSATELHRHGIRPPDYRCRSCRPPRSHILQDSLVTSPISLAFLGYQPEPGGRT